MQHSRGTSHFVVLLAFLVVSISASAQNTDWIRPALRDSDPLVRQSALKRLAALGTPVASFADEIFPLLRDKDPDTRYYAEDALMQLGVCSETAIRALGENVGDRSRSVRQQALLALAECGPHAALVLPAIQKAVDDPNHAVRESAVAAIGSAGAAAAGSLPILIKNASAADPTMRSTAVTAIGAVIASRFLDTKIELTEDEKSVPPVSAAAQASATATILDRFNDKETSVRLAAARAMAKAEIDSLSSETARKAVLSLGNDPDEDVRAEAASLLGWLIVANSRPDGSLATVEAAWEHLTKMLADEAHSVRSAAISAMIKNSPPLGSISAIAAALHDPAADIRKSGVLGLKNSKENASEYVPELVESLRDADTTVRANAALALGVFSGDSFPVAADGLARAVTDTDMTTRMMVASSLGSLLITDLKESQPVALTSAESAAQQKRVSALYGLLNDPSDLVRLEAIKALEQVSPFVAPQLDKVHPSLHDNSSAVRVLALTMLGNYGQRALPEAKEIVRLLADPVENVRISAAEVLRYVQPEARAAIPALTNALDDPSEKVKKAVVETLGRYGEAARDSVPRLVALVKKENFRGHPSEFATTISMTLARIGTPAIEGIEKEIATLPPPTLRDPSKKVAGGLLGLFLTDEELAPERLNSALKLVKSEAETAKYEATDATGHPVTLTLSQNEPLILVASWCPYSAKWRRIVTNNLLSPYLQPFKIHLLFEHEWPTVLEKLKEQGEEENLGQTEIDQRLASLRKRSGDPDLFDPAFLQQLTADHSFILKYPKGKVSFPSVYNPKTSEFDGSTDDWLGSLPIPPRILTLATEMANTKDEDQ